MGIYLFRTDHLGAYNDMYRYKVLVTPVVGHLLNVLQQESPAPYTYTIIISSQVVRSKKVDAHLRFNLIGL